MPNKMQNGKATLLTEADVSVITKELKNNAQVTNQLTYEAGSTVANTTTRLEVIANYKKATDALVAMLSDENKALQNRLVATTKERDKLQNKCDGLQIELNKSKEWRTIKWMEQKTGKSFKWQELVRASKLVSKEPKKVFDANYGKLNAYHIDAWEKTYGDAIASKISG